MDESGISAVVLDLGLPDGRGGDVLARLRSQGQKGQGNPPWIVMTAQDRMEAAQKYGPLGDHFLAKPFDPWDLVHMLQGMLPAW
jgi:two-component system OmpR family response regulator/two-component system response regulator QseB